VVLVAIGYRYLYNFLVTRGVGVHYNEHFPGSCKVVPGITCGSEQISVASLNKDNKGLAFITNGLKEFTSCNLQYLKGNIYLFDFNNADQGVTKLTIESSDDFDVDAFAPHGMDILESETERGIDLYVVNHANHVESVEVFHYRPESPAKLKHARTIRNKEFLCLNDLQVTGENQFFITNWLRYCEYPLPFKAVEFYGAFKTGSIVYYNDGESKVVANGAGYNGISQSVDGQQIIVASGSTTQIDIYNKDSETGELTFDQNVDVGHFPDNIYTDHISGDFYIGVQKNTLAMLAAAKNQTLFCSASGVRVAKQGSAYVVTEVFHDSGKSFIQGVATVAHYEGQYLLGSVFHKLVHCVV